MSDNARKKERSKNFSPKESNLLLELCNAASDILENKKTDSATNNRKATQWKTIEKQFNLSSDGPYRSAKSLHLRYENYKKELRKMATKSDKSTTHLRGTEAGLYDPPKDSTFTPEEEVLFSYVKLSSADMPNYYGTDSDNAPTEDDPLSHSDPQETVPESTQITEVDWSSCDSKMYRTRKNASLTDPSNTANDTAGHDAEFLNEECETDESEEKEPKSNNPMDQVKNSARLLPKSQSNKQRKLQRFEQLAEMKRKWVAEEINLVNVKKNQMKEIHSLKVKKLKLQIQLLERKLGTFSQDNL